MGKRVGKPYDPALRETEVGKRIYAAWRGVRKGAHCEEWGNFPDFYNWAVRNGYTLGAWLRRIDKDKPYASYNCVWHIPGSDEEYRVSDEWAYEWNRTVNRIRKHYGMPPLEGTKYDE